MPGRRTIVHYDFTDTYYSSFFVTGFLANVADLKYAFRFAKDLPAVLINALEGWRVSLPYVLLFQAQLDSEPFYFCIETGDTAKVSRAARGLLDVVEYYFKVNLNRRLVDNDPELAAYASKILPAAPFFPVATQAMRFRLPRLMPYPAVQWGAEDVLARFKGSVRMRGPRQILKLRRCKKTHDVFFMSTYYPEANHAPWMEFRGETMREIRRRTGINSVLGFVDSPNLPSEFADLRMPRLPFGRYMRGLAAAKMAVYVRGLHDCVSFKFSEFLALGLPIVGQSVVNDVEVVLRSELLRKQLQFNTPKRLPRGSRSCWHAMKSGLHSPQRT